ncbi:uncharacterized protein LOC129719782 [Wyeomyia smithii]|uniref:uncharacterized protein LOC129719782 n=1 Tax=Wyeomyia smithii TaxID=174621 RepID=UPI00246804B6|nr:uncharacterized protein LOC129719782 [Wyeomyia smithii]
MLNYDFDIQYIPTNEFGCADLLSRLIDRTKQPEEEFVIAALNLEEDLTSILSDVAEKVPVSFAALRKATLTNSTLQTIAKHIRDGWPACSKDLSTAIQPYYNRRETLSLIDGIHIDDAGPVDGVYFLVIVDLYSKWPEVHVTKSTTTKATLKLLNHSFATFGVPETIVSKNGTQYANQEFRIFCSSQGICHIRIAPYHPQSNGLAERFVDTLKRSLRKIRSGGKGPENQPCTLL